MNKGGTKFRTLLIMIGVLPTIVAIVFLSVVLTGSLQKRIKEGVVNELRVAADQVNEYFAYDIIANGEVDYDEYSDHEYIESLQDEGIELTLFQGDTRFITSLKKDDGSYNEGTQADATITAKVEAGSDFTADDVVINGTDYFVYYKPIYDGDGNFWGMAFAGEKTEKVTKAINSALMQVVFISVVLTILVLVLISFLGIKLSKSLTKVIGGIDTLAQGKLNTDFSDVSMIKEFNMLSQSGDELQKQLVASVGGAKNTATDLESAVENVDNLSVTSAEGTARISETVGELATTAQSLAETVQDANEVIFTMGDSIDQITENINGMNQSSDASIEANETAILYMDKLENASARTAQAVNDISDKIAECSEAAEKIKTATVAITEISNQTNLLSLNASIEAARAGEAGRGFAVVAGEIQGLAEQSNNSATEIQGVIAEILEKVDDCVKMAGDMNAVIKEQTEFLDETKDKIQDMSTAGKDLADGVGAIDQEAKTLLKLKDEVLGSITDLSAISEENAASSQEVTNTVDDIALAVASTKDESKAMRQLAEELGEKMKFFEV